MLKNMATLQMSTAPAERSTLTELRNEALVLHHRNIDKLLSQTHNYYL